MLTTYISLKNGRPLHEARALVVDMCAGQLRRANSNILAGTIPIIYGVSCILALYDVPALHFDTLHSMSKCWDICTVYLPYTV